MTSSNDADANGDGDKKKKQKRASGEKLQGEAAKRQKNDSGAIISDVAADATDLLNAANDFPVSAMGDVLDAISNVPDAMAALLEKMGKNEVCCCMHDVTNK
jgi:phage-related minor tail protein